ncbi:hypothetical protein LMG9964_06217 [Paraburkholderia phenoliruptrix]|uniref:Uncharacterized protein n=1 Tax=Paraburkholderia phenoliruptrix TaxID=252970 RepID=A0A6J5KG17_9BURK|nr:hypothetical protein LMG9964_06217 [Paraburkholderia phenoliruptrix]
MIRMRMFVCHHMVKVPTRICHPRRAPVPATRPSRPLSLDPLRCLPCPPILIYRLSQLALPARAGAGFAEQYRRRGRCRCWTFLCDFNVPHAGHCVTLAIHAFRYIDGPLKTFVAHTHRIVCSRRIGNLEGRRPCILFITASPSSHPSSGPATRSLPRSRSSKRTAQRLHSATRAILPTGSLPSRLPCVAAPRFESPSDVPLRGGLILISAQISG